jgi:zinc D-Ala-D-Ala dipeptidase
LAATAVAACTSSAAVRSEPTAAPSARPATSSMVTVTPTPTPSLTPTLTPTPTPSLTHTKPSIPPLSAKARAAGLVDIRTVVPDAIIDLRYATANNFTGVRLYPKDARCLVHRTMVPGLRVAARRLRHEGYLLVFWDCYRPHAVQVRMFKVVPNPDWVARPGPYATSHESGRSVDVSLARAATGRLLRMGTGFDNFTPRAWAYTTAGVGALAQANRARLRTAMAAGGLSVYSGEWWHFDGPGSGVPRPILGAPVD